MSVKVNLLGHFKKLNLIIFWSNQFWEWQMVIHSLIVVKYRKKKKQMETFVMCECKGIIGFRKMLVSFSLDHSNVSFLIFYHNLSNFIDFVFWRNIKMSNPLWKNSFFFLVNLQLHMKLYINSMLKQCVGVACILHNRNLKSFFLKIS